MAELVKALPLLQQMIEYGDNTAVICPKRSLNYRELIAYSARAAAGIIEFRKSKKPECYLILLPSGCDFITALLAVWRSGNIAVPLSLKHTVSEWEHCLEDSGAVGLITNKRLASKAGMLTADRDCRRMDIEKLAEYPFANLPNLDIDHEALIIYTSGTTSRPKGVLHTHATLTAMMAMLVKAWAWSKDDSIIDCLPLHHVHGLVNVLLCGLWSGAEIELLPDFSAEIIWQRILDQKISLFMAVPTIYSKLAEYWQQADSSHKSRLCKAAKKLRLYVSGSAAMPIPLFELWRKISKHEILERYGMSEIGMALSNPYDGERRAGTVGQPLPGVKVRIKPDDDDPDTGELLVRSPTMFKEYWQNTDFTKNSFSDGWFETGDIVSLENGYYRILGRKSVDIIKSGGFKISALEVENVLLGHDSILEVAVVGIEDPVWGERVGAAIVEKDGSDITPGWLKGWAGEFLAAYKLPTVLVKLDSLPRNAMGKVNKKAIKQVLLDQLETGPH